MHSEAVIVLLVFCAALQTFGKSHFLKTRVQEDCAADMIRCQQQMNGYQREVSRYRDATEFVQSSSLRQHCSRIVAITSCLNNAMQGNCYGVIPAFEKNTIQQGISLVNYVCVNKIDAFERNSACFMNSQFEGELTDCQPNIEQCDVSRFVSCAQRAMDQTPSCTADAQDLFEELMTRMIKIIPGCRAYRELKSAFKRSMYLNF